MPDVKDMTDREILLKVHDALFTTDGRKGLCQQVEENTKAISKLWIAIVVIASSVGGGAYGIIQLLAGN